MREIGTVMHLINALADRHGGTVDLISEEVAAVARIAPGAVEEAEVQYLCGRISAPSTRRASE